MVNPLFFCAFLLFFNVFTFFVVMCSFFGYNYIIILTTQPKEKQMVNRIAKLIWGVAIFMAFLAGTTVLMANQGRRMEQYAVEHNCRWDYNDMCYTKEQRPWLFNK